MKKRRLPKRKKRKIIILTVIFLILLTVPVVLCFTVFFPAKEIIAEGSTIYSSEQIAEASGIDSNRSIFSVNREKVSENIRQNLSYIGSVTLKRKLPGTVIITVSDAVEQFCYKIGGFYYTVGSDNYIISKTQTAPDITAVICEAQLYGDKQNKIKIANTETEKTLSRILSVLNSRELKVNIVDVTDINDIKVMVEDRFTVNIGSEIYIEEKISMLNKMIETLDKDAKGTVKLEDWTPENHASYFVEENK